MTMKRKIRYLMAVTLSGLGATLAGCSDAGPKTYPVVGRVEVGGGPGLLAGHHVELTRADDPTARAAGVIDEAGRFRVETLDRGRVTQGTREGSYHARLVIGDEGDGRPKPKVPRRYLDFKTSGWSVQVPAAGDVTLTVAAK